MEKVMGIQVTEAVWDRRWIAAIFGLVAIWTIPIWHFSLEWNLNPQYHYGWLVPLLSLYLVRLRMADCPSPTVPWEDTRRRAVWTMLGLVFLYFPVIVVRVANPEWRPLGYIIALQAIGLTGLGLYLAAGWQVTWHFAFPIAFFLVAVPWPRPVDAPLMDFLMQKNASVAIEGLMWQGIAASRKGNLVILQSGVVGVDEACSGIRSLQGTLMIALFLGELYRLAVLRRTVLLFSAAGVALLTNAVRTYMLARVAAIGGVKTVETWHDSTGYTILTINFALLWLVAILLNCLPKRPVQDFHDRHWLLQWWRRALRNSGAAANRWQPPAVFWAVATVAVIAFSVAFSGWWYERGESSAVVPLAWRVEEPVSATAYEKQRIPDNVLIALRQDSGWTARWKGPEDSQLQGWYLRWQPGRNAAHLANMHDPRICLGGLGLEMQAELGTWQFQMGNLVLPVETFRFRDGASVVHVYYVLLDDKPASRMGRLYNNSVMSRLEAAMEGVKQRGQRLVEIGLWGDYPESKARAVVEQFLRTHTIVDAQG